MSHPVPASQFELIAAANGFLSSAEITGLIEACEQQIAQKGRHAQGTLSGGVELAAYRRSQIAWLKREDGFDWLYKRVGQLANGFNQRFFGLELTGIEQALQVARYDASQEGGYDWHTDFSQTEQTRKLSLSIQLSQSGDYEGGDLEFDVSTEVTTVGRERGLAIAFPSFVRHRVAPVTAGVRYSLVAWVHGPRWR